MYQHYYLSSSRGRFYLQYIYPSARMKTQFTFLVSPQEMIMIKDIMTNKRPTASTAIKYTPSYAMCVGLNGHN